MSSFTINKNEELLGGNKFTDFLAQLDPTSSKLGGQVVKGALSAAGTLVGIPPMVTYGGFTAAGAVTGGVKASQKAAQQAKKLETAAYQPQISVPASQSYVGQYITGKAPVQSYTPLIFAAGAGVILLAVVMLLKK